jgi:hypothetical protein
MRASLFRLSTCPKLLGDTAALTLFYAIGRCRLEKDCTPPQIGVSMFIVNKRRQLQQCLQPCDKQHSGSHCNSRKIQCDLGARPVPKAKVRDLASRSHRTASGNVCRISFRQAMCPRRHWKVRRGNFSPCVQQSVLCHRPTCVGPRLVDGIQEQRSTG